MKTIHIIVLMFFTMLSSSIGSSQKLTVSKWKAKFFTSYGGMYELYMTEGRISKIFLTPYETLDQRKLLSVIKIESDGLGYQPRYHLMGDLVANEKDGILRLENGEKWEAVQFISPYSKKKISGLRVNGVLYQRVRTPWPPYKTNADYIGGQKLENKIERK